MKRFLSIVLVVIICILCFASCDKGNAAKRNIRIGVVLSGDENDSYIALHINSIEKMKTDLGISNGKIIEKKNVTEESCFETINSLVDDGCNLIFSVGDGFEDYMVQAATENDKVDFCVCDGTQAATSEIPNLHSYSAKEFESRYVAGVAAGLKLADMIDCGEISASIAKIGYIGSIANAENISAYSAFYLGAKSVCPEVTMEVQYAGAENSKNLERIAANALIANGVNLIAQQCYTNGAAETCQENNIYFVGCINSAVDKAPDFAITSTTFDWAEAYKAPVNAIINHESIPTEWSNGASEGSNLVIQLNNASFSSNEILKDAKTKIDKVEKSVIDGTFHVFDTSAFTVNGQKVATTLGETQNQEEMNPEDMNNLFVSDVEYISEQGYFMENELSSQPKFELKIDGITNLN